MILNISQGFSNSDNGKLNWSDIYFDYVVHAGRALCVKSAGNASNAGYVTSPGRGYNSLAVGNINDGVDVAWSDDGMNAGSSALNPETGGEKPEIAAYGTFVRSTTLTFPWVDEDLGVTGTSFAAPVVSGIAALCVSRDPTLAYEPEALKAMVLTSGVAHNVEGDARLSGLDGAGAALSTAASVGIHVESLMPGMFDPQHRYELSTHVPLTSGDPVRIVLVYSHPPDSESASPSVSSYKRSDLDLELYVNGLLVASSSFGQCNPFEIIDYPPSANGTARIKIVSRSWHSSVAVLRAGIAYASKSTLGTSP
jgi:hypothetical protein